MEDTTKPFEQAAAFQKIWMDTFTKVTQAAFVTSPDSAPPEVVRQIRSGIFQAVAQAWEEFMRSPEFLESMKRLMDNAIAFRKMSNELLTKAHHELRGTSRADTDGILLALRHMEERMLGSVEELNRRLDAVERKLDGSPAAEPASGTIRARPSRRRGTARTAPST